MDMNGQQSDKFPFDIGSELKKALQYHQSGQLQKAEEIYKKIVEINPNHSDSLHLLGVIAHQFGKNDIAENLGCITFGSFNHRAKITPGLVRLWSKLLNTLPNAQIILKSKPLSDIGT